FLLLGLRPHLDPRRLRYSLTLRLLLSLTLRALGLTLRALHLCLLLSLLLFKLPHLLSRVSVSARSFRSQLIHLLPASRIVTRLALELSGNLIRRAALVPH